MICNKCIHKKVCTAQLYKDVESCDRFEDRDDYVKVVRCKDCGIMRETEDERYLFCMQFADTVDRQAFCSYGERKE